MSGEITSRPPLSHAGRTIAITGAARGLGRAYARLLATLGANLVLVDVDGEGLSTLQSSLADGRVLTIVGDVAQQETAERLAAGAESSFGALHAVVNNAGISAPGGPDATAGDIRRALDVHLFGTWFVTQAAWPLLCRAADARVVMTTSGAALYGARGHLPYATAKGAVWGLARALATEARAAGISVNTIVPGAFTELAAAGISDPDRRAWSQRQQPAELVAPAVAYLCHPTCQLNGITLLAKAGRFAEVMTGETRGWLTSAPTAEELSCSLASVRARDDMAFPADTDEAGLGHRTIAGSLPHRADLT